MPTCYLVTGTPRSGTSAVAGVLHHLGVPMGEKIDDPTEPGRWDFPQADEWNPRGYFQDAGFSNLEDAEFVFAVPANDWEPSARFLRGLEALIRDRSARGGDWGLKSNRVSFYLDRFRAACPDAVKVITTARPLGRSLASWNARGGEAGGERFIRAVYQRLAKIDASLVVDYDSLHDATAETIAGIAAFVGRQVTPEALACIAPELRRH